MCETGGTVYPLTRPSSIEWFLSGCFLVVALAAFALESHEELSAVAAVLLLLNVLQLLASARDSLRSGLLGKTLFTGAIIAYLTAEALSAALAEPRFGVPSGLPVATGQFDPSLIKGAFVLIAVFQLGFYTGFSFLPRVKRFSAWLGSRVDSRTPLAVIVRVALVACVPIPLLAYGGFDLTETWRLLVGSYKRLVSGIEVDSLLEITLSMGIFGSSLALSEAVLSKRRSRLSWATLGALSAILVLMRGTRHQLMFLLLPMVIILWRTITQRGRRLLILKWAAVGAVLLLGFQLQLAVRSRGWNELPSLGPSDVFASRTTGQFDALLFAEYLVPEHHGYFFEPVEVFFVVHWIPRFLWSGKPVMESWEYYSNLFTNSSHLWNATPSVIGQYHMSWGIFGVIFIGVWLGALTCVSDRLLLAIDIQRQHAAAVLVGMMYAFVVASFRFYSPYYFSYCLLAFFAVLLITRTAPCTIHLR